MPSYLIEQLSDSVSSRRMTERSKTLGPGFMRTPGQANAVGSSHYDVITGQDGLIPSRFSTLGGPETGRYYTGPGSTEEAKERMMHMEAQLSQLTGMVEKALKNKRLGKKTVSFDKAVSFRYGHNQVLIWLPTFNARLESSLLAHDFLDGSRRRRAF